jgi:hypothetical protein
MRRTADQRVGRSSQQSFLDDDQIEQGNALLCVSDPLNDCGIRSKDEADFA